MTRCFNGHSSDLPGCPGCHYAFHVKRAGQVEGGRLVPPVVDGPEECDLCHEARHATPVPGCPRCAESFAGVLEDAQRAAAPLRGEILLLKFKSWALGWQAMLGGWFTVLLGGAAGDWFRRPDGSHDLVKEVFLILGIPAAQWIVRREIRRKERQLPRLSPTGEIVYGPEDDAPR